MKNKIFRNVGILTILLLASGIFSIAPAQQGHASFTVGERPMVAKQMEKLKLTEDQQKQMDELKAKFQEETLTMKNLIREKLAHIKTLIDMDNRDIKDLDKTIDELSAIKGDLMKKGIAHRDAVKKILTPEQMKVWDFKAKQRMQGMRQGPGQPGMMRGGRPMRGAGMQMGGRGLQMRGEGRGVEVEGNEIEVEGRAINAERKTITVEGKELKGKNQEMKEEKTGKKKKP